MKPIPPRKRLTQAIILAGLLCGLMLCGLILRDDTAALHKLITTFSTLYEHAPVLCWILFLLLHSIVALCGILPASVGAIASGMIFGIGNGFLIATIATQIGAFGAFYLARTILRAPIQSFLERRGALAYLDGLTMDKGWRFVCLLRLSPILPFAVTSYAFGLTHISVRHYVIGTLASLPALLGYVLIGDLALSGASDATRGTLTWVHFCLTTASLSATGFLIWSLGRNAARHLKRTLMVSEEI